MGKRRYVMIRKRERPPRREGPSTNKDGLTARELIREQDERIRNMTPAELAASLDGLGEESRAHADDNAAAAAWRRSQRYRMN